MPITSLDEQNSMKSDHMSFSIGASIDGWQLLNVFAIVFVVNVLSINYA
jgi:hypothetical protein